MGVLLPVKSGTKKFLETYIEFSCVAWSGRGETPVGLARQSETPEAKLRRLSASPTESEPLERKATSLFKGTNKYTIQKFDYSLKCSG